eukprot:COSAG02_NODE_111_length_36009_cov_42.221248_13_plen_86_part_00
MTPVTPVKRGARRRCSDDAGRHPLSTKFAGKEAATCHFANAIRTPSYASGEVRGVSWLKGEERERKRAYITTRVQVTLSTARFPV